jgi:hypothetical protein
MCCGKYKHELFRQDTVNQSLIKVHNQVMARIRDVDKKKKEAKTDEDKKMNKRKEAERELYSALKEWEFIIKLRQALIINTDNSNVKMRKASDADGQQNAFAPPGAVQHQNTIVNQFHRIMAPRDEVSMHDENQSETSMQHPDRSLTRLNLNQINLYENQPVLYFGNHYVGHKFNIDDIESTIN